MTDAVSPAPSRAIAKARTPGLPYLNVQIGIVIVAILVALIWRFGFPLLITIADIAALCAIALLAYMTYVDGFSEETNAQHAAAKKRGRAFV